MMPPINAQLNDLFWQICGGVSVGFLAMVFVVALTRKLFGTLDEDAG